MRRAAGAIVLFGLAVLQTGCLVEVRKVSDAASAFRAARAEAARYQGRPGPARRLNVLVFDPDEHELVRVSLPFWLARKCEGHIDWDGDHGDRIAQRVRRHVRLDELEKAGLGLLADIEEDDGAQVLVWLR
jgi:hypothetical protein